MDITEAFIDTFWAVGTEGVKIVVPVVSIWLTFKLFRSLVLGGK